jgi:C-terminal processing protease CtpA/Prc
MADGKSLENVGVMPDEEIIPTAKNLAAGEDVVMTHALEVAGAEPVTAAQADKFFPYEWPSL